MTHQTVGNTLYTAITLAQSVSNALEKVIPHTAQQTAEEPSCIELPVDNTGRAITGPHEECHGRSSGR